MRIPVYIGAAVLSWMVLSSFYGAAHSAEPRGGKLQRPAQSNRPPVSSESPSVAKQKRADPRRPTAAKPTKRVHTETGTPASKNKPAKQARRKKTSAAKPLAAVQPKPDLSYHGLLEQPGRYDPSPGQRRGAAPNPQAGDVLHDHFQELDRNRDGLLDPFERSLGRLDMDRDVSNRRWD